MTCIVVFAEADGIMALSDTATVDLRTGRIMSFVDKVEMHPARHMVVAQAGLAGFLPAVWLVMGNCISSLDDFEDAFPAAARIVYRMQELQTGGETLECSVCVAGWSDRRNEYTLLCTASYAKTVGNLETGEETVREPFAFGTGRMWMSGKPEPEELRAVGLVPDDMIGEMERRDRLDLGTRLVFAKRLASGPLEPNDKSKSPYYLVGGSLILSRLGNGYASQQVLYRWKDRVGEVVDLSQDDPPPKFSFGPTADAANDPPVETAG